MLVVFRADASIEIGTGHVMRCLALAQALRETGASCWFISRALPGHLAGRIEAENFQMTLLPEPTGDAPDGPPKYAWWAGVDWVHDAAETRNILETASPEWLVMDHYSFGEDWQRTACPSGTKLMVIDDLADRRHAADLLLDQNLGHSAATYDGLIGGTCRLMTGPDFSLLRPEFAAMREHALANRWGRRLRRLLITMGGIDLPDATSAILDALREMRLPEDLHITVIMGSGAPALERVKALAFDYPKPVEILVDVPDMAAHMALADLAISAGGTTTWERCCLGLPSIILETAENQSGIAQAIMQAGAGLDPGSFWAPEFAHNLRSAITKASHTETLRDMSIKAARVCDGMGAKRVAAQLLASARRHDQTVRVRLADAGDAESIWIWRYAGDASKYYRNQTPVSLAAHKEWFSKALEDHNRILLIVENEQGALGHVRFDRQKDSRNQAEISIYVNPIFRGHGYGEIVITHSIAFANASGLSGYFATISTLNTASQVIFKRVGFTIASRTHDFVSMKYQVSEECPEK